MQFSAVQCLLLAAGMVLVIALALASVAYGSAVIPLADVLGALAHAVGLGDQATSAPIERIIVDLRLPRVLLGRLRRRRTWHRWRHAADSDAQ